MCQKLRPKNLKSPASGLAVTVGVGVGVGTGAGASCDNFT